MNQYTIYCTKEQTLKALELGAPIEMDSHSHGQPYIQDKTNFFICPTAEQMIGWIESVSTIQIHIEKQMLERGTQYRIWVREGCKPFSNIIKMFSYSSRREATIAAIDAALEYHENTR